MLALLLLPSPCIAHLLMFASDDSEKRKEQLLALQKSKLERYEVELTSTRKVGHQLTDCILYYHSVVSHSLHLGVCSTAARDDCFEHLTQSQSEVLSHTHTHAHTHTHTHTYTHTHIHTHTHTHTHIHTHTLTHTHTHTHTRTHAHTHWWKSQGNAFLLYIF